MEQKKKETEKLVQMVYAGLFAAMTALLTATLHIPVGNGYIHCGDAVIYLSAAVLPLPYAVGASAIGGMMADLLSGYPMYALPTFLIKGLLALTFSLIGGGRKLNLRRVMGWQPARLSLLSDTGSRQSCCTAAGQHSSSARCREISYRQQAPALFTRSLHWQWSVRITICMRSERSCTEQMPQYL